MKKMFIAVIVFISGLLFCSCGDIIDIGEPHKYLLVPDTDKVSTIVKPYDSSWLIVETYNDGNYKNKSKFNSWGRNFKFIKNNIDIDTAGENPVISIDIEVESTVPDITYPDRKDRVSSFRLKLDSINVLGKIRSEFDYSISDIFGIYIKTINDQKTYYLNKDEVQMDWIISEPTPGIISGNFKLFIDKSTTFETEIFGITFDLYYPKKKK